MHSAHLPDTPAGPVTVWVSGTGLRRIEFGPLPEHAHTDPPEAWPELLEIAVTQLREYFARERNIFDLPLDLDAVTDFQRSVYDELLKVGYGRLTTYGDLANSVRRPELARAVGQAVGANPIPIVIPCEGPRGRRVRDQSGSSGGAASRPMRAPNFRHRSV